MVKTVTTSQKMMSLTSTSQIPVAAPPFARPPKTTLATYHAQTAASLIASLPQIELEDISATPARTH